VVNWSFAIQLHLFENISPTACLSVSQERVLGHRKAIGLWITFWLVSNVLLSSLASGLVVWLARRFVPELSGSLWRLVLALGGVLTLWGFVNLVIGILAVITSTILLAQMYDRFGRGTEFQLPGKEEALPGWSLKWTRGRLVALLSLLGLGAALVGVLALNTVRLEDHVQITAHRGGAIKAPENTLAAIRQAIQDQSDWVEIDVQESKDGVVMVAHDSDLKKVSGANLKIWEGTADELRAIDIGSSFGPEFHGERVPTLEEVLKACRGKTRVNIELKYYGHNTNLEEKVVDLVEANGMESDVVIMSLNSEGIAKVKSLRPHWRVGLLTAVAMGDLTRSDADFLAVSTKLANRRFIQAAHQAGKDVHVWTVNDRRMMSTMISRGADNLITDDPGLARQVLNEWAELPLPERVLIDFALRFGLVPEISSEAGEP
jgi:glycerophosphoryl diester phosphodiesterase